MPVPVSDLQAVAPSAIIELYELQLNVLQHGVADLYRFHSGANLNSNGQLIWNGNTYQRFPLETDGFEYNGSGQLPRPKVRVSNILSAITALLLTLPRGLEGAQFTRIRTLARYLDAANFPGGVNPYGTPDPTAEFPREIYYVDRKASETQDVVEFELAAAFDLAGVRAPKRQCVANLCQWVYKSVECGFVPAVGFTGSYSCTVIAGRYSMSGTTITVTAAAHGFIVGDRAYFDFPILSGSYSWPSSSTTVTITANGHGYSNGDRINIRFTASGFGDVPSDGYFTVGGVTTNTFTVTTASNSTSAGSGSVKMSGDANPGFYAVATATTNSFTITSNTAGSGTTQGGTSGYLFKGTATAHGLTVGQVVYLDFLSGAAVDGQYTVGAVTTNTFCLDVTAGAATSGNLQSTQWFDAADAPVFTAGADSCGKRLSSCKIRFGITSELPFGSFPGIGAYFG